MSEISVIIPVRNGARWIREAVLSVIDQTFPPMEILVADDASTDTTVEIVESIGSPMVRVLRSSEQMGVSRQCNRMIAEAKGRYIARMDGDDIADPDRFRLQMEAFHKTDVSVLGTWARRFGTSNTLHTPPVSHERLLAMLGISCPFINPTVTYDRQRLGVDPTYDCIVAYGEDYAQFASMRKYARFGNLPKVLLRWRLHDSNAGSHPVKLPQQSQTVSNVRRSVWAESGIHLDEAENQALDGLVLQPLPPLDDAPLLLSAFEKALAPAQPDQLWAPVGALREQFLESWGYYCRVQARRQPRVIPLWWRGVRQLGARPRLRTAAFLALKSLKSKRP